MNQLQAFRDTIALAKSKGLHLTRVPELSMTHLEGMLARIESDPDRFSPSKLGRWLGWAQAAVVSWGDGITMEDMKRINLDNRDEPLT
jgi:hypothetical protein